MLTAFNSTLSAARQRHPVIVPQIWTSLTHICFRPPSAAPHCHHTNTHHSLCSQGYSGVHLWTIKPRGFLVTKLLYKESIHVNTISTYIYLYKIYIFKVCYQVCFKYVNHVHAYFKRVKSSAKSWKWFWEENLFLVGVDESVLQSTESQQNSLRQNCICCISSFMYCTNSYDIFIGKLIFIIVEAFVEACISLAFSQG